MTKSRGDKGIARATYKVGYGKPPEEWRFGARRQPNRVMRRPSNASPDLAALLDRPMQVKRNGKPVKMHPHEAMLHGLFARVAAGEIRAIKQFLRECKRAGLLDPPPAASAGGVVTVPKEVPMEVARRLVEMVGPPPWDHEFYGRVRAEYDQDLAHLERLRQETIAEAARANGEKLY
jgi:hypothetical protein